jgi:hypothetical protein
MGVMEALGFESLDGIEPYKRKVIESILLEDDQLSFGFTDDTILSLADQGQSCCELRYMRTDDNLEYYFGAELLDIHIVDAADAPGDPDHEIQFLVVVTSKGTFSCSNHNEHNGYYGGFSVQVVANQSR